MKKIFFTSILISLLSLSCSVKHNKPVLDGFFELKFGMTEEELRGIVDVKLLKETKFEDILWDEEATKSKGLKIFHLDYYKIDDGYIIEEIQLSFFQNKLYSIETRNYNSKTEDLLTQKYDKPIQKEKRREEKIWKIKKWETGGSDKRHCGSIYITDLDDNFIRYTLLIHDETIGDQASSAIKDYWDEIKGMIEEVKKQVDQPRLDRL